MSHLRNAILSLSVFTLICAGRAQNPATGAAPSYTSDPKYVAAMAEAATLTKQHKYVFALDDYKKANKIAGGSCFECLKDIYGLQMGMGSYKDAIATATQLEALAISPTAKSVAAADRGAALLLQAGDKPKPAQLEAAHDAFQAAITQYPKNIAAQYQDGCVLAKLGKDDDASKEFASCAAAASPTDPMRVRAQHFAENPSLATHKMAPAFEVTALDGSKFNLDNMGGRVVLIDFWATWCGPCNEELPNVQKIAKEFANEPFTVISISWDADETKWKDFIGKHDMTWLQYRDADHKLSERFGVNAIPHYFTIDSDGVLTAEMLGSGNDVEGKIKKLLKRAKESKPVANQVASISGTN